jgi:hypothetical protein
MAEMTEVQEIETAIERLERFKFNETWEHHYSVNGEEGSSSIVADDGRVPVEAVDPNYADLIVILHRTIDAQLGVLRAGRTAERIEADPLPGWAQEALALATPLARAINGVVR